VNPHLGSPSQRGAGCPKGRLRGSPLLLVPPPSWLPSAEGSSREAGEGFFLPRADEEQVILFPEKVCKKQATRRLREIPKIARCGNGRARRVSWVMAEAPGWFGLRESLLTAPSDPFPNRAGNFPALLMSPSCPRRGFSQEKSLPLEGKVAAAGGRMRCTRAACPRSGQAVSPKAKWHGSNRRFEARHRSPQSRYFLVTCFDLKQKATRLRALHLITRFAGASPQGEAFVG